MTFQEFFSAATGKPPHPYQRRFAEAVNLPHLIRAPTGAGKTATAVVGWLWRRISQRETSRRLVYCLPMRVLVEQSVRAAQEWIDNLYEARLLGSEKPQVHVLMGGVEREKWYLHPEKPAILIGTQDMLLSRALNRGYGESRFHWPIDFGLLNNDCLWVFDEPQLMGSGVSTSAQLAGLRQSIGTMSKCPSIWMSATLEPGWLDTIDFRDKFTAPALELASDEFGDDYHPKGQLFKRMAAAKSLRSLGVTTSEDMKGVAPRILGKGSEPGIHESGTQTLIVVNTVKRAKALYDLLKKALKGKANPKLLLIHSRFRPCEREALNAQLVDKGEAAKDRIIVATQVVEAGVDISSRTLVTELAPWASIVQRIGRCNRTGDDGDDKNPARVYWIDLEEKHALPYEWAEIEESRTHLRELEGKDISPKSLAEFKERKNFKLPFEHKHVLRRRDLIDLFDTAPDLSGNDIDISRFVRGDDPDIDVQVFWRRGVPDDNWDDAERRRQAPRREELCTAPIGSFKKEFLDDGKTAYRWDYLDSRWKRITKREANTVIPGQIFWISIAEGGYDIEKGWTPDSGRLPDDFPVPASAAGQHDAADAFDDDNWAHRGWQTIATHTDEVVAKLTDVISKISMPEGYPETLLIAARWHDWGKIHPVFQRAILREGKHPKAVRAWREKAGPEPVASPRPAEWIDVVDLAKAPDGFWTRYRPKRFRHELASALGVLALLNANSPLITVPDVPLAKALIVYLIAAHHGKIRLSIRVMPDESPPDGDQLFACGVRENDELSMTDLGAGMATPTTKLDLSPMLLGGVESWLGQTQGLVQALGPFRLAWLESLIRAADCRASAEAEDNEEDMNDAAS